MAPGGEMAEDLNGDGFPDGVLSTHRDANNQAFYNFLDGTSMATPHVTGLVALMKSVNPGLNTAQATQFLKDTANAAFKCSEGCGAGLVNAQAAVIAARGQPTTGPAKLSVSTTDLFFNSSSQSTVTLSNLGGATLTANATVTGAAAQKVSFPGGTSFNVAPQKAANLVIAADASGTAGTYAASVQIASNGGNAVVNVRIRAGAAADTKNAVLAVVYKDASGTWQAAGGGNVLPTNGYTYSFDVAPGSSYYAVAAVDDNGNGVYFEPGERVGMYKSLDSPDPISVVAGQTTGGINFTLVPYKSPSSTPTLVVGSACTSNTDCLDSGACVTAWPGGYCTRDCATTACPTG
jgi:serine protease